MDKKLSFIIFGFFFVCFACQKKESIFEFMDKTTFKEFGGTLFSTPTRVTMKEIHLDNGLLTGRVIVLEGKPIEVSDFLTYTVLADDTARILVVLTQLNLENTKIFRENNACQEPNIRVLGTLEIGKKGFPYILARAIRPLSKKDCKKA